MNRTQAINRLIQSVSDKIETDGNDNSTLAIALRAYRVTQSDSHDIGVFILSEWDIDEHGLENSQYFVGAGVSFTSFDHIATGCGDNPHSALEDALEQIAMQGIDIDERLQRIADDYAQEPSASDADRQYCADEEMEDYDTAEYCNASDRHFYLSVRYNRAFSVEKTADQFVESIVNGNPAHVVKEMLTHMPQDRALAVTALIGARGHCEAITRNLEV